VSRQETSVYWEEERVSRKEKSVSRKKKSVYMKQTGVFSKQLQRLGQASSAFISHKVFLKSFCGSHPPLQIC